MGKRAFFVKLLQDARASYWLLPTLLAFGAILLAQITQYFDHHPDLMPARLPDAWRTTQVDGARSTLALISQSMIGVAGVMFSMTLVAVSFASGNYGPRLIGNFMRDRGNQWSLGILISTFVYTLLILRGVQSPFGDGSQSNADAFVPHLSLLVALTLTGLSVMSMIYYVHHIPEIINVSNISAKLGNSLKQALQARIDQQNNDASDKVVDFPSSDAQHIVQLQSDGYIQTWNQKRLKELAQEHNLFLDVRQEAGDFVTELTPVLAVWDVADMSVELTSDLRNCFAIGTVPTEPQNLLFIIDELVEMIARALSPGVNDPFTAINCMNWIHVGLAAAADYKGGLADRDQGRVRFKTLDFTTLLSAAFRNPLSYICSDPLARAHLEHILNRLKSESQNKGFQQEIDAMLKDLAEMRNRTKAD